MTPRHSAPEITAAVTEVIDALQNDGLSLDNYVDAIERAVRCIALDTEEDTEAPQALETIRQLTMLRRDIITLGNPPDADDPTASSE